MSCCLLASVRAELETVRRENEHLLALTNQRSSSDERQLVDRKLAILRDQNSTTSSIFYWTMIVEACRDWLMSGVSLALSVCFCVCLYVRVSPSYRNNSTDQYAVCDTRVIQGTMAQIGYIWAPPGEYD